MKLTNLKINDFLVIIENEIRTSPIATLIKANIARKKVVFKSINDLLAIIAKGIKYKPIPRLIEVSDTLTQFSETIPAAIKTVPQTGGVIVDNNANQKTNKCT